MRGWRDRHSTSFYGGQMARSIERGSQCSGRNSNLGLLIELPMSSGCRNGPVPREGKRFRERNFGLRSKPLDLSTNLSFGQARNEPTGLE